MKYRLEKVESRLTDVEVDMATLQEKASNADRRLDGHDAENEITRKIKHEHNIMLHTHNGILKGIEGTLEKLNGNVEAWAIKTEKNTLVGLKTDTTLKVGISVIVVLGTAFAGFVVFVGGQLAHWW